MTEPTAAEIAQIETEVVAAMDTSLEGCRRLDPMMAMQPYHCRAKLPGPALRKRQMKGGRSPLVPTQTVNPRSQQKLSPRLPDPGCHAFFSLRNCWT